MAVNATETRSLEPARDDTHRGFVWRCSRCGRFLAKIDRLDGALEVYHKCGAMNRLEGVVEADLPPRPGTGKA